MKNIKSMDDDRYEYYGDVSDPYSFPRKKSCMTTMLILISISSVILFLSACDNLGDGGDVVDSLVVQVPVISITTDTSIYSRDIYVNGTFTMDSTVYKIQIRGRGNSTWFYPKKPYKIKFENKVSLFGYPADKEWALLANYVDKSLIRNDVGFEISRRLEMDWTPRGQFVDLYLNGAFQGNYYLVETVKVGKDRLNISLMDAKKDKDTSGSFLVEADYQETALQHWRTNHFVRLGMKDPETLSPTQFKYVMGKFDRIGDSISAYYVMNSSLNIDSWIKWTLVNELMKTKDATLYGSCYFYKDLSGKVAMGPVWDMDLSAGNNTEFTQDSSASTWYLGESTYMGDMFRYGATGNQYYKKRMKEIWATYRDTLSSIGKYIDRQALYLNKSQKNNYDVWGNLNKQDFLFQYVGGSYEIEVKYLKSFVTRKSKWIETEIKNF